MTGRAKDEILCPMLPSEFGFMITVCYEIKKKGISDVQWQMIWVQCNERKVFFLENREKFVRF